jgi:ribosomal protein L11 methyltransferase
VSEPPRFPFVLVDVAANDADVVSAELFDLGAQGVEERDATTLVKGAAGKVTLVASFASREEAEEAVASLDPATSPRIEEIVGDEWRDKWKEHFRPFELCPGLVIAPPWDVPKDVPDEQLLVLEPGRAFGTGLHETTRLVARALHARRARLGEVLDVGCGSGILALVALGLGAPRARCTDIDPEAAAMTRENADRNGLTDRVEVDTTPIAEIAGRYPIVLANIEARVLVPMAADLRARVADGGLLVLSGVLVPQKDDVARAYLEAGDLRLVDAPVDGDWVALVFERAGG